MNVSGRGAGGGIGAAAEAYTTTQATLDASSVCNEHHSLQQHPSLAHGARPGIEPASSLRRRQVLSLLSHTGNSHIRIPISAAATPILAIMGGSRYTHRRTEPQQKEKRHLPSTPVKLRNDTRLGQGLGREGWDLIPLNAACICRAHGGPRERQKVPELCLKQRYWKRER